MNVTATEIETVVIDRKPEKAQFSGACTTKFVMSRPVRNTDTVGCLPVMHEQAELGSIYITSTRPNSPL